MAPEPTHIISGGLLRLLADTIVLLYKVRHLSWLVNGGIADGVRRIVEQDHRSLDDAADKIAKRIIALGRALSPSYQDLIRSSSISQELTVRGEMEMILQIVCDHEQVLADIETLEVTLPLAHDAETAQLLCHLSDCHKNCRQGLLSLIRPPGETVQ